MLTKTKKIAISFCGWLFIFLGVLGLFLPVLQGVFFLLIGLLILSSEYAWAHRLLLMIRNRFPAVASQWDAVKKKTHRWNSKTELQQHAGDQP